MTPGIVGLLFWSAATLWGLSWLLPIIVRALRTGVIEGRAGFYDRQVNARMFAWTLGVFIFMAFLSLFTMIVIVAAVLGHFTGAALVP